MGRINKKIIETGLKEKNNIEKQNQQKEFEKRQNEVNQKVNSEKTEATSFLIKSSCNAIKLIGSIAVILLAFIGTVAIILPTSREVLLNIFQ